MPADWALSAANLPTLPATSIFVPVVPFRESLIEEAAAREENEKMLNYFSGADIVIHDAQYTAVEFEKHLGWGHSSYEYAIEAAAQAGVKKLIFHHHDPNRTDEQLKSLEEKYKNEMIGKSKLEIIMAREGLTIEA